MRILYDVSDGADEVSDNVINFKRVSRVFQFSFNPIWYVGWTIPQQSQAIIMHSYVQQCGSNQSQSDFLW